MYKIPPPDLQVDFSLALAKIRGLYLQDALSKVVKVLDITEIDHQLAAHVPKESLASLASNGLGGELVFPVPLILGANPRLLGYYRLLYGFSQKEFYTAATGVARFHSMEKADALTKTNKGELAALCRHRPSRPCLA